MKPTGKDRSRRMNSQLPGLALGAALCAAVTLTSGCNAKNAKATKDDNNTQSTAPNASGGGTKFGGAETLKDLNLAGFLAINLPDSVAGKPSKTAALRLTAGKKSREACELRSKIRESLSNLAMASQSLCMIQQLPGAKFGKKLNIDLQKMPDSQGPGAAGAEGHALRLSDPSGAEMTPPDMPKTMQFWADTTSPDKMRVYLCQDRKLIQSYTIDQVTADKKTKGSVILKMAFGQDTTFHTAMAFDSASSPDRTAITIKEHFGGGSTTYRRMMALSLSDRGVSRVVGTSTFANGSDYEAILSASGAFSPDFGSVISGLSMNGSQLASNVSYFDAQSNTVDHTQHPDQFDPQTGKVAVAENSMPKPLPASFKPEDFGAGSWDCSGTEELNFDAPPQEQVAGCDDKWSEIDEVDCNIADYEDGPVVSITSDELVDSESYDKVQLPEADK